MSAAHNSRAQLSNSASTHIHCFFFVLFFMFLNWDCLLPLVHSFCCCTHPPSPLSLPGLQTFTSYISFIVSTAHLSEKNHKPPPPPPPPVPGLHTQLPSLNYRKPPWTKLANKATKKTGLPDLHSSGLRKTGRRSEEQKTQKGGARSML